MNPDYFPAASDFESTTSFLGYNTDFVLDDLSPPPLDPGAEGDEDMENEEDETDMGVLSSFNGIGALNTLGAISANPSANSDNQQTSKVAFADELSMPISNSMFNDSLPISDMDFDFTASIYQNLSAEFDLEKFLNNSNNTEDNKVSGDNKFAIDSISTTPTTNIATLTSNNTTSASVISSNTNDNTNDTNASVALNNNQRNSSSCLNMNQHIADFRDRLSLDSEPVLPFIPNTASTQLVLPEPTRFEFSSVTSSPLSSSSKSSKDIPSTTTKNRRTSSTSSNMSTSSVLKMQNHTVAAAISAASRAPLSKNEPVHTDEERKRRNRVYAKRSRDLKNQKYRESMTKNKDLEERIDSVTKENQELKLQNQRLEFLLKEARQKLITYGVSETDEVLDFHLCSRSHIKKEKF